MKNRNPRLARSDMEILGRSIGASLATAQFGMQNGQRPYAYEQFKEATISPTSTSIYGRNSIFDPCSPGDVFGLQVQTIGLMPWLGWRANRFYRRRVDFIPW